MKKISLILLYLILLFLANNILASSYDDHFFDYVAFSNDTSAQYGFIIKRSPGINGNKIEYELWTIENSDENPILKDTSEYQQSHINYDKINTYAHNIFNNLNLKETKTMIVINDSNVITTTAKITLPEKVIDVINEYPQYKYIELFYTEDWASFALIPNKFSKLSLLIHKIQKSPMKNYIFIL